MVVTEEKFRWSRMVLKVGSSLIAPRKTKTSTDYLLPIASFILQARQRGKQVILVSSGSVAAGQAIISGDIADQKSLVEKQALAAVGQNHVMQLWQRFFDFPCAQVLLTHDELNQRQRYVNARNTLRQLIDWEALPIVNENDSVAVDELRVGDNDNLAAHVAVLVDADLLAIASDVDGLFSSHPGNNPDATLIDKVVAINDDIREMASGIGSSMGTGGMQTKLQAFELAKAKGIGGCVFNGKKQQSWQSLLEGENPGTWFFCPEKKLNARKHWLRFTGASKGKLRIDSGALKAVKHRGASLLYPGISEVIGEFLSGELVDIVAEDVLIARGIVQFDSISLNQLLTGVQLVNNGTAVHRNDLVLMESQ